MSSETPGAVLFVQKSPNLQGCVMYVCIKWNLMCLCQSLKYNAGYFLINYSISNASTSQSCVSRIKLSTLTVSTSRELYAHAA